MINSSIKFEKRQDIINGELVETPDYFSKDFSKKTLYDLIPNLDDVLIPYQLKDNDKIERISYELYGSTDYWDIIVIINEIVPLFSMPYDYSVIEQKYSTYSNAFFKEILSEKRIELKESEILEEELEKIENLKEETFQYLLKEINEFFEENRYIKVVAPSRMPEVLRILRIANYI